jgi:hypothetical protein
MIIKLLTLSVVGLTLAMASCQNPDDRFAAAASHLRG